MSAMAAYVFTFFITCVIAFQIALAAGAPWGTIAMGGRYPGKFPLPMRIAAFVQAGLMLLIGCVVLVRAQLIFPGLYGASETAIWFVIGLFVISLVMNLVTPSKWERIVWAPVGRRSY